MKLVLVILALSVAFVACTNDHGSFIVGGNDATIQEYPFMARILNFGLSPLGCGGSIVSASNVLTAAHCIYRGLTATISVTVGSSYRAGSDGVSYRAIRVTIHPDYVFTRSPFMLKNDLAIIRTRQIRFGPNVQPIPIGTTPVPSGEAIVVAGWGAVGDSLIRDQPNQLQRLDMFSITNIGCKVLHVGTMGEGVVTDEKLCLMATNNRGICDGDSGSPAIWNGEVVGVAAWIVRPCGSHPSIYIRVEHHIDWIRQQL